MIKYGHFERHSGFPTLWIIKQSTVEWILRNLSNLNGKEDLITQFHKLCSKSTDKRGKQKKKVRYYLTGCVMQQVNNVHGV